MNIVLEFFVVTFKVLWAFVVAAAKWLMRPKEKSVAGQVCLITGAGSGLGRLFALEFARRRARLVLWDINTQSNEETAGMVRHIYREVSEEAMAAAQQGKGAAGGRAGNRPEKRACIHTCTPHASVEGGRERRRSSSARDSGHSDSRNYCLTPRS